MSEEWVKNNVYLWHRTLIYKSIHWRMKIDNKYLYFKSSPHENMEITQFYVPKSNMKLKLLKNKSNDFVDTKDLLELSNQRNNNSFPMGIWDWAQGNYGYCTLHEFASIADYSNEEILWEVKNIYILRLQPSMILYLNHQT